MESAVKSAFGESEIITLDDLSGEFAFITDIITEEEYEKAAAGFDNIITRIRIE